MERKKVSQVVPVQAIIPRSLYAELVKICAESDYTIKEVIQSLIEDFIRYDKFCYRKWQMSDEQWHKGMDAYEIYTAVLEEVESLHKEKEKKHEKTTK